MLKCSGELTFIILYVVVFIYLIIGLIYQIQYGRVLSILVEFAIALAFDQIKSILAQLVIYWVVIRRLNFLPITPEFNGKWDDDTIYSGGTDSLSLFGFLRKKTQDFVEHRVINSLILGMTLFLCLVIFSELSISEYIDKYEGLGNFYKFLNFFLLTFFMIEIILKSFALGYIFISEFINVFDSVIVIVSFAFLLIGSQVKILGLLRILRLIKVVSGMKKVVDDKRER